MKAMKLSLLAAALFAGTCAMAAQTRAEQTKLTGAKAIAKFPERLRDSDIAHLTDAVWCELMDGVEYFYGEFDKLYDTTANDVYYFKINYQQAKVRMEFVDNRRNGGSNKTTSYVANQNSAIFGINCTFPKWYAKMDGSVVMNGNKEGGLALNDNKTFEFFKSAWWKDHPSADGYRDAFSTEALGLYHGERILTGTTWDKAPYTFMGATQDGSTLYVCVVDGRTSRSQGLGYGTVHDFLVELGCYDGMCLDGGGSTTMVCKKTLMPEGMSDRQHVSDGSSNYYTMNNTSDGSERAVCNQLLFVACEAPELTSIAKPSAAAGLVYNGKAQIGVPAGDHYTISGNTGTAAGSYQATVTPKWGFCWQGGSTDPVKVSWSIGKAPLTVTATGAAISYGETLAASVLTGTVVPNVAGTFAWADSGLAPCVADSGITAYAGTFVPTDAENYLGADFTATLVVNRRGIAVPTARDGLVFNFSEQTGVEAGEGYSLTGEKAMETGEHVATATLTDKDNTCWADGEQTLEDKEIVWSIADSIPVFSGVAEAGTDWNGSDVVLDVSNLNLGSHALAELRATLDVNGKTYDGLVTAQGTGAYRVSFLVDADGANAVTATEAYEGEYRLTLGDGSSAPVEIATGTQTLLQGLPATDTNGWFRETAAACGQTGVWTRDGVADAPPTDGEHLIIESTFERPFDFTPNAAMGAQAKGVVEARLLFDAPGEEDDMPPPDDVRCAARIVEDDDTGVVKLQVYAALPDGQDGWTVGWYDWNTPEADGFAFVRGNEYAVRFVCDYETGTRALVCSIGAPGAADYVPLFSGYLTDIASVSPTERISSVGVFGNGKLSLLEGTYTRDFLDASLASVGGQKFASVADAVAAAGGAPITLLHRASWRPDSAAEEKAVVFVNPDWLVLLSAAPEIFGANRIGVCSWSWHDNMTSILARMKQGGFKGMQLALSPWIWDDDEATAAQKETFGDVEGDEVLALIRSEAEKTNIVIHATMICFADEDYTSTTTISNTCGLFYGLAPSATSERANAESKWAHRSNQFERAAILTGELGVPYLTAHLGLSGLDDAAAGYPRLYWAYKVCRQNGCKLLIETGMYSAKETAALLTKLVQAHPDIKDSVGINFDSANQILYGTDNPTNAFPILRKWIDQVHVKDCVEDLSLRGGWATDVEWGLGDVSQKYDFIAYLRDSGFKGPLLVEHESGEATADARADEILTAVRALITSNNADDPTCPTPDWIDPSLMEGDTPAEKSAAAMKAQGFSEPAVEAVAEAGDGAYETVAGWSQSWADGWEARGEAAKPMPADIARMPGVLTSAAIGAAEPLTEDAVKITSMEPSTDGGVSIKVSLGEYQNLKDGNEALLKAALGVTGAYGLGDGESFSAENVDVSAKEVEAASVELKASPKPVGGQSPTRFFFKALAR